MADSTNGDFREFKKMKIWVEQKSGYTCMMLYPRGFDMSWGGPPYMVWNCYKETSDDNIEVAKVNDICLLDVVGHFKMSELSSGVVYEIAYIVKLTKGAYGWETPIKLIIRLPNASEKRRHYCLLEEPREKWIELVGGSFQAMEGATGEATFVLSCVSERWKRGLIIKGIIIRPKID